MFSWIAAIFKAAIYTPLYNGLVFLVGAIPTHDMGIAVIVLTLIVRFVLFPLSRRAVKAQLAMKELAPEVAKIKEKYKDNSEEQAKATFALYKEKDVHPFAGSGLTLIQLPIIIGLYYVFLHGGLPKIDSTLLYSFIHAPSVVNMEFLGLIDMRSHSIVLAALAAISQFVYMRLSMGRSETSSPVEASLSGDIAKGFEVQARYVLPIIIGVFGYTFAAAVPLYYTASNVFMIVQEYVSGRRF